MPRYLLIITFISSFIVSDLFAQDTLLTKTDTIIWHSVRAMRAQLKLSEQQYAQVMHISRSKQKMLDSLDLMQVPLEIRGRDIQRINILYYAELRVILTSEQWAIFKKEEEERRHAAVSRLKEKGVIVKELPVEEH